MDSDNVKMLFDYGSLKATRNSDRELNIVILNLTNLACFKLNKQFLCLCFKPETYGTGK